MMVRRAFTGVVALVVACAGPMLASAADLSAPRQSAQAPAAPVVSAPQTPLPPAAAPSGIKPPDDYVIGAEDVLIVSFWRDKDMSGEVAVRPDGKISLPLINDIVAAGLTPDQLRLKLVTAAEKVLQDPSVAVGVKQINSRKVFITGEVEKQGPYNLLAPTTVLQLISMAGGVREYAHSKDILILRKEGAKDVVFHFDYTAVRKGSKLQQNILLKPGDTVIVP